MDSLKNLKFFWKNKKVYITGHTGFKGSWLSIFLNILGSKVYGYSFRPKKNSLFEKAHLNKIFLKNTYGDINNQKKIIDDIKNIKPDILFHLAAQPLVSESYKDPFKTFETNILGTLNVLEASKKVNSIKSILLVTTDKVYKDQGDKAYKEIDELGANDPYSTSKACMELLVETYVKSFINEKKFKSKISTVRSGNVVGGGDIAKNRLIPDILNSINKKKTLIIRNPNHIRPWQHVIEPLYGYIKLAQHQYSRKLINGNSWNFGPNKGSFIKVYEIVRKINDLKKIKYKISNKIKFKETNILKLDSTKSKHFLKWHPKLNIHQTINFVIKWNDLYNINKNAKQICENQILEYLKK